MIGSIVEWRTEVGRFQDVRCEVFQCPNHNRKSNIVCDKCVGSIGGVGQHAIVTLLNLVKEVPNE